MTPKAGRERGRRAGFSCARSPDRMTLERIAARTPPSSGRRGCAPGAIGGRPTARLSRLLGVLAVELAPFLLPQAVGVGDDDRELELVGELDGAPQRILGRDRFGDPVRLQRSMGGARAVDFRPLAVGP